MSELPHGWVEAVLGHLGVEARSGFPSGRHNSEGIGIPHLRPMNVDRLGRIDLAEVKYVESDRDLRITAGDVLFNNTNSPALIGKTAYFDKSGEYAFSNHMTRLRPPVGLEPEFLAAQLHYQWSCGVFRELCSHHVNQSSVSTKTLLRTVRVSVPPTEEQRRIVAAIEAHFSRLDAAEAVIRTAKRRLDRMPAAVLLAAFRDVRETRRLTDVAEVRLGRQRSPKNHIGPNMRPYLRAANVTWAGLDLSDVKSMNFSPSEVSTYELVEGDVLLSEASGSADEVGKPAIWRGEIPGCCFQNTLIRVRSRGALPEYLHKVFLRDALTGKFAQAAPGVGIHHLGSTRLSAWPVPLAPLDDQRRIVAEVERQLSLVDVLAQAIDQALARSAALRRAILELAFTGRLVPQDPSDEPASALLERIRGERTPDQRRTRGRRKFDTSYSQQE